MKLIGIAFVLFSASSVGFRISKGLGGQCRLARQILHALQVLRNEIACCCTPLPQAFALLAVASDGALESIFSRVAREMDRQRWLTPEQAMISALEETSLGPFDSVLRNLCVKLGKYDVQAQIQGIEMAKEQTEEFLHTLEAEQNLKSKTYKTLGICAGLALVILLI